MKKISVENLAAFQQDMEIHIEKTARAYGLLTKDIEPITDGVCDFTKYLASEPSTTWVLKEPWDEIDPVTGTPAGGGYSIPNDCFPKGDTWKNPTYQPIIYALYGFRNGLLFNEMDSISDDHTMAHELNSIAYINVSKMPAFTQSGPAQMRRNYQIWKDVLWSQIIGYASDIVVCCGTYKLLSKDADARGAELLEQVVANDIKYLEVYRAGEQIFFSTLHPLARTKGFRREHYVNTLISALRKYGHTE